MTSPKQPPIGIDLKENVAYRANRRTPYRARVRWTNPQTGERQSLSEAHQTADEAADWIDRMKRMASAGIDPLAANMNLADYGDANMELALRGLEVKTLDPYLAGWRRRVIPPWGTFRYA